MAWKCFRYHWSYVSGIHRPLRWRHNGCDSVSNHQPHHCLLNRLFRRRSKKTSKLRVTGLCTVISPGTGEFSAQMASNAENVSIWWRHHGPPVDSHHKLPMMSRVFNLGMSIYISPVIWSLMFSMLLAWTCCWTNNRAVSDLINHGGARMCSILQNHTA